MTICFKDYPAMKKFMTKLFSGDCKDSILPRFSDFTTNFLYKQVSFENTDCEEMKVFLNKEKIPYNWVNQF